MAISQLEVPKFKARYGAAATSGTPGTSLANGYVYVTTTGGTYTTVADRHTVYTDKAKTIEATRDQGSDNGAIALDAAGEVELWFDGTVDIRFYSSGDELQDEIIGVESSPTATITGNYNLVQNGSFEIDAGSDGSPDNWTLAAETNATIAIDSTTGGQFHGNNGLKFTAAGSGGGTATSTLFDVANGKPISTSWKFKQDSAADGTYSIVLEFYDFEDNATSNITVWSSTSGAPTAWTEYTRTDSVPAGSTQAKLRLTGLANSGSTKTGSCWFDDIQVFTSDIEYNEAGSSVRNKKNYIYNGDFRVAQRGTTFTSASTPANSDDTYLFDRWILLSDGNDIVDVSQETSTVPSNSYSAIKLDVETINKKFGVLQILETKDIQELIGAKVSLSFQARVSSGATIGNIRAAVLAWDSTADTVTSDVVSAWNTAATDPTLVANWTYENTPSSLAVTDSYQTFKIEDVYIDTSGTNNVAVFIWSDDVTTTLGDLLYISDVQLEFGRKASNFEQRLFEDELHLCQRYYEKSYSIGTAPGTAATTEGQYSDRASAANVAFLGWNIPFKAHKRVAPTMAVYSPVTGTIAKARNTSSAADEDVSSIGSGTSGWNSITLSGAPTDGHGYTLHWIAEAEL